MSTSTILFSPEQSDEEVLAIVIAHYFTTDELERARELARAESYEAAIAYLSTCGRQSLRDSGEEHPPRVYMTLPTGDILIHHPARLFPGTAIIYAFSITHLALRAFSPLSISGDSRESAGDVDKTVEALHFPWCAGDAPPITQAPGATHAYSGKRTPALPRTYIFQEQAMRLGTKHLFWTRSGWAVKKGFLGYVLTKLPSGTYRVELIHLVSYWVMADVYLDALDETTHARLQGWVSDAHALTDWSRGINSILKEKTGKEKKWAWARQLKDLWYSRRQELRQLSFF